MGLPVTRKTATEEDQGEDNKDPDWLIEQSIARQVAPTGDVAIVAKSRIKFDFLQRLRQQNIATQVAVSVCYTWQFFEIVREVAYKLSSLTAPSNQQIVLITYGFSK